MCHWHTDNKKIQNTKIQNIQGKLLRTKMAHGMEAPERHLGFRAEGNSHMGGYCTVWVGSCLVIIIVHIGEIAPWSNTVCYCRVWYGMVKYGMKRQPHVFLLSHSDAGYEEAHILICHFFKSL